MVKDELEELKEIKDGIAELANIFNPQLTAEDREMGITSVDPGSSRAEVILGYITIRGKRAQITLKAETDEGEWLAELKCEFCEATAKGTRNKLMERGWSRVEISDKGWDNGQVFVTNRMVSACPKHKKELKEKMFQSWKSSKEDIEQTR